VSAKPKPPKAGGPFAAVQSLVRRVPRGRVITYGELSRLIGRRLTPLGVVWAIRAGKRLPWHRVVNSQGGISRHEAPEEQRARLIAEGVTIGRDGKIDLERFGWWPRPKPRR
jgi:methylated-DNA-protein-cysteine methyltransferase-like protein